MDTNGVCYYHNCHAVYGSFLDPQNQLGRLVNAYDFGICGITRILQKDPYADMLQALFIASAILATLQNSVGGYRHVYYLSEDAVVKALEYNYILRATVILSYATGKASVGALILRLIGRQNMWQKWAVWVLIVFTAIVNILNMIFNFVQCNPVNANWDPRVKLHATCWDGRSQLKFAYFMCGTTIIYFFSAPPRLVD